MSDLPDWIFGELITDLGEFLGGPDLTLERCEALSGLAGAEAEAAMHEGASQDEWWAGQSIYLYNLARHHVVNEERWRELYARFPGPETANQLLLDFGCGIGTHTLAFAEMGWRAEGTDLGHQAIAFATERARKWASCGVLFRADSMPPRGWMFELIFVHDVVGHLTEPELTLGALHDAIMPGGRLYLTYNNTQRTEAGALHRNAEVDFPALLTELGMQRESEFVWRRPE